MIIRDDPEKVSGAIVALPVSAELRGRRSRVLRQVSSPTTSNIDPERFVFKAVPLVRLKPGRGSALSGRMSGQNYDNTPWRPSSYEIPIFSVRRSGWSASVLASKSPPEGYGALYAGGSAYVVDLSIQ